MNNNTCTRVNIMLSCFQNYIVITVKTVQIS